MPRKSIIIASVFGVAIVAAGLGVLIWWLVTDNDTPALDDPPFEEPPPSSEEPPPSSEEPPPSSEEPPPSSEEPPPSSEEPPPSSEEPPPSSEEPPPSSEEPTPSSEEPPPSSEEPQPSSEPPSDPPYDVIELEPEGDGIGSLQYTAALTSVRDVGNVFWWFYPSSATARATRPTVVWLDGVTGLPPSLLANLGMIGPYDFNFERRENSWVDYCNLLFVDSPVGTGYSTPLNSSTIPTSVDENAEQLLTVLQSFYSVNEEYRSAPLYIFGQGDGAKSAVALAIKLNALKEEETGTAPINIQGIAIGNGIISPALVMTKLGLYLEELGYINRDGRNAIEDFAQETNAFVNSGDFERAFDNFISLGDFVDQNAGAIAVNLGHIVEKLSREPSESRDYFGQWSYVRSIFGNDSTEYMNTVVGPALGISSDVRFDSNREAVMEALKASFMTPYTSQVEYILQNTNLKVTIYNGNLDGVSNTPGQLEWVDNLQWDGQTAFRNTPRRTLVVNRLVEGYFRETERLTFYWINVAGQSAPLDNPVAMRRLLQRMIGE